MCVCVFKDVGFMMFVSIGCFVVKFRFFVTKVPGTVFLGGYVGSWSLKTKDNLLLLSILFLSFKNR